MKNLAEVVAIIEECQGLSQQCWEMAIATDDGDNNFADDADECDECYTAAIDSLEGCYERYIESARNHLVTARDLERQGGDDKPARIALAALAELEEEGE